MSLETFIAEQIAAKPVEAKIVRKIVRALKAAGTPVTQIWDSEEYVTVSTEKEVMEQAFNLDEIYLDTESGAWVRLTMGEGYDMLTDYSVSLDDALAPVRAWIEANDKD